MKKMTDQFGCSKMMLPQQKIVVDAVKEQEIKEEKAFIDEQRLEEFDILLKQSLENGAVLRVTVLKNNESCILEGRVKKAGGGNIILKTHEGMEKISMDKVLDIQGEAYHEEPRKP